MTRDTQTCSICRGTKKVLKNRSLYERSPHFLIVPQVRFEKKYVDNFRMHDHCFIDKQSQVRRHVMNYQYDKFVGGS